MNRELKTRSLLADKEMVTAKANSDLRKYGEWQCDYESWYREIDVELASVMAEESTEITIRERDEARELAEELRNLVRWTESEPWEFDWEKSQSAKTLDEIYPDNEGRPFADNHDERIRYMDQAMKHITALAHGNCKIERIKRTAEEALGWRYPFETEFAIISSANAKSMASPGGGSELDQKASTASPSDPC